MGAVGLEDAEGAEVDELGGEQRVNAARDRHGVRDVEEVVRAPGLGGADDALVRRVESAATYACAEGAELCVEDLAVEVVGPLARDVGHLVGRRRGDLGRERLERRGGL